MASYTLWDETADRWIASRIGVEDAASLAAQFVLTRCRPDEDLDVSYHTYPEELMAWTSGVVDDAMRHRAAFWDDLKAELMARAWHPGRMIAWCMDTEERDALESDFT